MVKEVNYIKNIKTQMPSKNDIWFKIKFLKNVLC